MTPEHIYTVELWWYGSTAPSSFLNTTRAIFKTPITALEYVKEHYDGWKELSPVRFQCPTEPDLAVRICRRVINDT